MLARAPGRLGEFRTRLAIGASAAAVVRQLFVEATLLVGIACSLGFVFHYWLQRALTQLSLFEGLPDVETDWRVATFVIGVGLGVAVVAGLLPAVRIVNRPALSINARGSLGQHGRGLRPLLVLQVSIGTLVVLAGALFVSEIWRLENAPLGFDPRNVVTARVMVPAQNDSAPESTTIPAEQMEQLGRDLLERISALPGVEGFAIASTVPIEVPLTNPTVVEIPGAEVQPAIDRRQVYENRVTPEFFAVLGARFAYGRPFDPLDSQQIVVSKTLAKHLWGREDVVGEDVMLAETQLMTFGQNLLVTRGADADRARPRFTVVGVVEDIRYSVAEGDYQPLLYRASSSGALGGRHYVVRTSLDPAVLMGVADGLVRERVQSMAADIPVLLRDSLYESLSGERARSRLALGAAVVALLLTIAGLYTSMQHAVDARRGELALRKAMGATDGRLARMILTQATTVVAAGSAMAFLAAVLFAERLRDLVLGLDPFSPFAWAVTLALIGITGIGAACWPAMRAASVEPASALHYE